MIIRMITAGEQTGKIDNMLERISDFLDEEIETTLSGLTSLIEPILIVFLGVVVGGMVICMFLPIFKMAEIVNAALSLTSARVARRSGREMPRLGLREFAVLHAGQRRRRVLANRGCACLRSRL